MGIGSGPRQTRRSRQEARCDPRPRRVVLGMGSPLFRWLCLSGLLAVTSPELPAQSQETPLYFPGGPITAAEVTVDGDATVLGNNALRARFTRQGNGSRLERMEDVRGGTSLAWDDPNLFTLHLKDRALASSGMRLVAPPKVVDLKAEPQAATLARRFPGKALTASFADAASGLQVRWAAILRDGSNSLRQELVVAATKPVEVKEIEMIRTTMPGAKAVGYTDGAPVACGSWFLGVEHPMARNSVGSAGGWTPREMEANQMVCTLFDLKPGPCKLRFQYQKGNHGLTIRKVALAAGGKVFAEDAHEGFAGLASRANEYAFQVPEGVRTATLTALLANPPGEFDGYGTLVTDNGSTGAAQVVATWPRQFVIDPRTPWTISSHVGVGTDGQMRRAFAYDLQRERAHPYRQYWHYNSWYDLNINRNDLDDPLKRMTEAQCLQVIDAFEKNLFVPHKVGLDGYVWDDGWDDWNTLWQFHKGFPHGFSRLAQAAGKQGAGMGAWLSPWGGYGKSHDRRVDFGRKQGFETNSGGLSLGGPKYRAVFRDTCLRMIKEYGQDYFKFDGIGGGMWATGAPVSISADLDGLISVIGDLRRAKPDVFINCTVGTWASPYWTRFADSIWRQGEDTSFVGKGNERERWINYRDKVVYDRFASTSPWFPLNSMMYHGLVVGAVGNPAKMPAPAQDPAGFRHEMQMMAGFASGLGELYVTQSLMTPEAWAFMAECIQWARARKSLLVDNHWVGGNPGANEIYGFAAWNPTGGGTLTLRNPDDQARSITLDLAQAWELPADATSGFELRSPWQADAAKPALRASAREPLTLTLQPFEVVTLEGRIAGK